MPAVQSHTRAETAASRVSHLQPYLALLLDTQLAEPSINNLQAHTHTHRQVRNAVLTIVASAKPSIGQNLHMKALPFVRLVSLTGGQPWRQVSLVHENSSCVGS
jgi:hypothetical protein